MFTRTLLAIAAIGCAASVSVATAQDAGGGCFGAMTIEGLSDSACQARIPVPVFRADAPAAETVAHAPAEEAVYITTRQADGTSRSVRLVGTRFLPQEADRIDFRARSLEHAGVVDRLVIAAAAYLKNDAPAADYDVAEVRQGDAVDDIRTSAVAF